MKKENKLSFLVLLLIIFSFILVGCSDKESQENMARQHIENRKVTNSYEKLKINLDKDISPSDIAFYDEKLYITSSKRDKIYICNVEGKIIDEFGETGNGIGEFSSPTNIYIHSDIIYVAEKENARIQMFDMTYKSVGKIDILEMDENPMNEYMDLIVMNDDIYISLQTSSKKNRKILHYNSKGLVKKIGKSLCGVFGVTSESEKVLFAQTFEPVKNGYHSGETFMCKIQNDTIGEKTILPFNFTPLMIEEFEGELYLFFNSIMALDKYDLNGKYIETLYETEDLKNEEIGISSFCSDGNGNFYFVNRTTGSINMLRKK